MRHPRSVSAKLASQVQIAALELMNARMAATEGGYASMGIACVGQDGMGMHVKNDMRSLVNLLPSPRRKQQEEGRTKGQEKTIKGNHRLWQLQVGVQLHKQPLPLQRRALVWALPVERMAPAPVMARAIQQLQSAIATQVGMEFFVTSSIVKAGMVRWVQIALAMDFVTQEHVSALQVGGKMPMTQTRQLPMCVRIKFAQLVVETTECACKVHVYVNRVGQGQTVRILVVVQQPAAAMGNAPSARPMPLRNVCAITDGVAVSANVKLCMPPCGNAPMTAVEMASVLMANASAMLATKELTALKRFVLILPKPGLGVISHGATTIALARACA
jgi:hypothetical protein